MVLDDALIPWEDVLFYRHTRAATFIRVTLYRYFAFAFARDLLNSDYAGHRLTFHLFAQSPPFAHLAAVYRNFDWDGPLDFVRRSAGLSDRVTGGDGSPGG